MRRKAKSFDVLGKFSAISMAIIVLLSIFVPMFSTIDAQAASDSYNGSIYVDFSNNSTWLAYAETNRVTVGGQPISKVEGSSGLYKTNSATFTGDVQIQYAYTVENRTNRLFFNGDKKYAYFWDDGGSADLGGAWPGMSMNKFDDNKYYVDYNSSADRVIFNDGNKNQTGDLTIGKTDNVYNDSNGSWTAYNKSEWTKTHSLNSISLSSRANDYANAIYVGSDNNVQWSRYDHSKTNPYTETTGEELVTVKLYAPNWSQANVLYDLEDPLANANTASTGTGTVTDSDGNSYEYYTLQVPANSTFKFYMSNPNSGSSNLTVPADNANLYYSVELAAWVTANNLSTKEKSDIVVSKDNFATAIPSSGGDSVIGVDAVYYDYLSNNERTSGWRNNMDDSDAGNAGSSYRMQFSNFNDKIKDTAVANTSWRYPLFFGDDFNSGSYIGGYWDTLKGTRTIPDNQLFYAVNNSGGLSGAWNSDTGRNRSVQGLVNSALTDGKLTVGNGVIPPYFNYDLLHNGAGGGGDTPDQQVMWVGGQWNCYYKIKIPIGNNSGKFIVNQGNSTGQKEDSISSIGTNTGKYFDSVNGWSSGAPTDLGDGWDQNDWVTSSDGTYYYIVIRESSNWGKLYFYTYDNYNGTTSYNSWPGKQITDGGTESGSGSSTEAYAKVVSAKFPFVAKTDSTTGVTTYSFDSSGAKDNVYFDWDSEGNPTKVNYGAGTNYGIKNRLNGDYGIFPFNNSGGSDSNNCNGVGGKDVNGKVRDYGFGVKMKMYFTLPENGVYGEGSAVQPKKTIKTESSGNYIKVSIPKESFSPDTTVAVRYAVEGSTKKLSEISGYILQPYGAYNDDNSECPYGKSYSDDDYYYVVIDKKQNGAVNIWDEISLVINESSSHKTDGILVSGSSKQYDAQTFAETSGGSSQANNHAMFNYSGDDDLWVFVDGQLVLDLGGAHTPTTGSIDFGYAPGEIKATANSVYLQANGGDDGTTDTVKNGSSVETPLKFDNQDPTKRHEMVVYYMERGTNDSNLKVSYSIQPVTNDLSIDKTVDVTDVNSGLQAAAKVADDFTFTTTQGATQKKQDSFGDGESVFYNANTYGIAADTNTSIAETTNTNLTYTTTSYIEDVINQQAISSTGNDQNLSFNFINAKADENANTSLFAHFTNKVVTQPLSVSKALVDENDQPITDSGIDFTFGIEVSLDGSDSGYAAYPLVYKLYDASNNDVLNSDGINLYTATGGEFQLKAGYHAQFQGIPQGAKYRITEKNLLPGYSIDGMSGGDNGTSTGTIGTGSNAFTLTNKFVPVESNLQAHKNLDGSAYTGTEFKFDQTLLYCNNTSDVPSTDYSQYADTVTSVSSGNVTFKNIEYTNTGKYYYSIRESLADTTPDNLYVMDSTVYYAVADVTTDANNQLQVDIKYYRNYNSSTHAVSNELSGAPTFNNLTATKYVDVQFKKIGSDNNPLAGAEFTLYTNEACTTLATKANVSKSDSSFTNPVTSATGTGLVTFNALKYEPSAGTATYYFKETKVPNGYQLLTGTFKIEITGEDAYKIYYNNVELSKNGDDYVVKNIQQPELPIAGGSGVMWFFVLGSIAVIGAGTAFILYKKRINLIALAKQVIRRK